MLDLHCFAQASSVWRIRLKSEGVWGGSINIFSACTRAEFWRAKYRHYKNGKRDEAYFSAAFVPNEGSQRGVSKTSTKRGKMVSIYWQMIEFSFPLEQMNRIKQAVVLRPPEAPVKHCKHPPHRQPFLKTSVVRGSIKIRACLFFRC